MSEPRVATDVDISMPRLVALSTPSPAKASSGYWTYRARLEKVVDGDTVDVLIDLGFQAFYRVRLRLLGVDAPEMGSDAGSKAKAFTAEWISGLEGDWPLYVRTAKTDKYGRYVATILPAADPYYSLNDALLQSANAVVLEV
jgi:micrococcal nuclease